MEQDTKNFNPIHVLIALTSFVIIVAGMRAAGSILVPFLLSTFIAIVCTHPLFWLQRKGIPTPFAVAIVVLGILVMGMIIATFIGASLNDFSNALPTYQEQLLEKTESLKQFLKNRQIDISDKLLYDYFNPQTAMRMITNMLTGLGGLLTNIFLILLTVIFMLFEASGFSTKFLSAIGNPTDSSPSLSKFVKSLNRYLAIKTIASILTGIFIALWLIILDIEYPLLWGMLGFILNYIPNIGSIIAAVPATLLGLIQFGPKSSLLVILGYIVINFVFGNIIEPRFLGRGLGLSTLVIFLSLIFWGWVLGTVGMFLSVPLTMVLKIAFESNEDTRWIAILLGPTAPYEKKDGLHH